MLLGVGFVMLFNVPIMLGVRRPARATLAIMEKSPLILPRDPTAVQSVSLETAL